MIRHIVLFKLKDTSEANVSATKAILSSMKGRVPQIIDIEVGTDFLHSDRSYDIALSVVLESADALDAYQKDKYHCDVVKKHMHAVRETSVAIDYNLD